MAELIGAAQLRARLRALRTVAKPILRKWGDETVKRARVRLAPHTKTGATARSLQVRSTNRRTTVSARWGARFLEKDTKAHEIKPRRFRAVKFEGRGGTVFAPKVTHPRRAGTPFLSNSARDALGHGNYAREIEKVWDGTA